MKSTLALFMCFVLGLSCFAADGAKKELTNAGVISMVKAEIPEDTIVLAIVNGPCRFDTSPEAIIELKNSGAGQRILDAVLKASSGGQNAQPEPSAVAATANAWPSATGAQTMMQAFLISGTNRIALKQSVPGLKTGVKVNPGLFIGMYRSYGAHRFDGKAADLRIADNPPEFEVGIPGNIKVSDMLCVLKVRITGDGREVDAVLVGFGASSKKLDKQKVPCSFSEVSRHSGFGVDTVVYRIKPRKPLAAGEYVLSIGGTTFYDFGVDDQNPK